LRRVTPIFWQWLRLEHRKTMAARVRANESQVLQKAEMVLERRSDFSFVASFEIFDCFCVEISLDGGHRESAAFVHDHFVGQILCDFRLGSTKNLRRYPRAEFFNASSFFLVLRLDRLAVALPKFVQRSQQPRLHEVEQA